MLDDPNSNKNEQTVILDEQGVHLGGQLALGAGSSSSSSSSGANPNGLNMGSNHPHVSNNHPNNHPNVSKSSGANPNMSNSDLNGLNSSQNSMNSKPSGAGGSKGSGEASLLQSAGSTAGTGAHACPRCPILEEELRAKKKELDEALASYNR